MMPTEEKTMKIKAKFDCLFGDYEVGDVFEAQETTVSYVFKDNNGDERLRHKSEFDVVPDEPAIEVGSVWRDDEGNEHTVKFSSENTVVYGDGDWCADPEDFLRLCKPKPKTVTMYFYKDYAGAIMASDFEPRIYSTLFTREIELP